MATVGAPHIVFGSTTVDSTYCIQVVSFTNGKEDISYRCGGDYAHLAGTSNIMLDFSIALAAADTAKVTAFAPGATGDCQYFPFGVTSTYQKFMTSKGTVMKADLSDSAGKVVTLDISIAWDDVTAEASTGGAT